LKKRTEPASGSDGSNPVVGKNDRGYEVSDTKGGRGNSIMAGGRKGSRDEKRHQFSKIGRKGDALPEGYHYLDLWGERHRGRREGRTTNSIITGKGGHYGKTPSKSFPCRGLRQEGGDTLDSLKTTRTVWRVGRGTF